jgi:hypothetical protein
MLPTLQRYTAANDYDSDEPPGPQPVRRSLLQWSLPTRTRGASLTDYETLRAMLERADLPTVETTGISGLSELHVITDEDGVLIVVFDEEGRLLTLALGGCAEVEDAP